MAKFQCYYKGTRLIVDAADRDEAFEKFCEKIADYVVIKELPEYFVQYDDGTRLGPYLSYEEAAEDARPTDGFVVVVPVKSQ